NLTCDTWPDTWAEAIDQIAYAIQMNGRPFELHHVRLVEVTLQATAHGPGPAAIPLDQVSPPDPVDLPPDPAVHPLPAALGNAPDIIIE
ncbi:hypothetical protein Tco_1296004, partial [Tanacetum coccineum]